MREFTELKVTIPEQVLFRDLEGESVLLHLGSGQYFGLDEVGTFVWNLLAEGCSLGEVEERVLDEYDAIAEQVHEDVARIVTELCDAELLDVKQESGGSGPDASRRANREAVES